MAERSYHHGGLRETLIGTAIEALERGETELSIRAIARLAGVSAMAPYRHFADKQALLQAVSEQGFGMLAGRLRAADSHTDHRQALIAQGVAYVAFAREQPALFRLMFDCADGRPPPPDDSAYGVLVARVGSLVREDARADAALLCWATVHGLATLALDGGDQRISTMSQNALALLVAGLPGD